MTDRQSVCSPPKRPLERSALCLAKLGKCFLYIKKPPHGVLQFSGCVLMHCWVNATKGYIPRGFNDCFALPLK
jgi:hypothetical protein